jgi:iron(III) transport system ATP-binding protein
MTFQNTLLSINDLRVTFPKSNCQSTTPAVNHINLQLYEGEIGCLLGPSGSGKSTVLRTICGFEHPQSGLIQLRNKIISSPEFEYPPHLRGIGMVFQDFCLFPHLTVIKNISFGLKGLSSKNKQLKAMEWLDRVLLLDKANSYPHELSGGEQQRVALARAMALEPSLILLDEPFSSLDLGLREQLALDFRRLLKSRNMTALMVTHDQTEAFTIADKMGVMRTGELLQWDIPYQLYHHPTHQFVAEFIGQSFFLKGVVLNHHRIKTELGEVQFSPNNQIEIGQSVEVFIRAEDVQLDDKAQIRATIIDKTFQGARYSYILELDSGTRIVAFISSHHCFDVGKNIGICLDTKPAIYLKKNPQS